MKTNEAEGIQLSRLANKVTETVHRRSTFANLKMTISNFAVQLEKDCNEKYVASCIVEFVKDMIDSEFLIEMTTQIYYRYTHVAWRRLRHKSVADLVESMNSDRASWKSLRFSQL